MEPTLGNDGTFSGEEPPSLGYSEALRNPTGSRSSTGHWAASLGFRNHPQ